MGGNNGQKGFINEDKKYLNPGNTISFGQDTATIFYQENPFFTGDKIKILVPKNERFNRANAQFFLVTMRRAFMKFSWGTSSFSIPILKSQTFSLPITNFGSIDFDFMESFIRELEEERIRELEEERIRELSAYLTVSGLDNCKLSKDEEQVLEKIKQKEWKSFRWDNLFDHIKQGRRLKKEDQKPGDIPFVMAGISNTGVVNNISNPVAKFPANSITVDIFGNTFYRSFLFGAGDDTGVYWNVTQDYTKAQMLFFAAAMAKELKGKFSFGKKLRSSQSFGFKIFLPVRSDGSPDYATMETFMRAVQKLVVQDVSDYAAHRIAETKKVTAHPLH